MDDSHELLDKVKCDLENVIRDVVEVRSGSWLSFSRGFLRFKGAVEGEFVDLFDGYTN